MSSPNIQELEFDDENEDKLTGHGLTVRAVDDILDSAYLVVRNKRQARGDYLVIGRDQGGRLITVVIEPTRRSGVWRPVTAWPSKTGEETLYKKRFSLR